jgi:methoxymalonate biosynthesis acyl carrier protein
VDINERVRAFFESRLTRFEDNLTIDDYENIFESGFVDSSVAMELVVFVEEEFGIQLTDDDLDLANFSTINRLVQFINGKTIN